MFQTKTGNLCYEKDYLLCVSQKQKVSYILNWTRQNHLFQYNVLKVKTMASAYEDLFGPIL